MGRLLSAVKGMVGKREGLQDWGSMWVLGLLCVRVRLY